MSAAARPRSTHFLLDEVDHRHRCRRRELELLVERCGRYFREPILEIGSGDGLQGALLAGRFGRLVGTDVDTSRFRESFPVLRARSERLPFRDASFRTVFSSSVLEHVDDLGRGLAEITRVLAPGGYMVHIVPTQVWISLVFALRLPYMVARNIYRALVRPFSAFPEEAWRDWWYAGYDIRLDNLLDVPVHGVSPSHLAEWFAFSHARWTRHFQRAGLRVVKKVDLYTYSPYGFLAGAEGLRLALARLGLPGVRAYVLTRARPCT
jgi:ubiquinone/menaquinone biosynthesis C-methylase UbiE